MAAAALTKNYYVAEEVRAALAYACKERRQADAVFWCHELVISHMAAAALETLYDCWLWTYGPCKLMWITMAGAADMDKLPRLAQLLAAVERDAQDSSMWVILRETKEQPDRVVREDRSAHLGASTLATYFQTACRQNKAAAAWWAAAQLGPEETLRLAAEVWPDRELWFRHIARVPLDAKATHCLIAAAASLWPAAWEASIRPIPLPPVIIAPQGMAKTQADGPRQARVLAIPRIALYGITQRGHMRQTASTIGALRDIEPSLVGPYWDHALKGRATGRRADGHILWRSDEDQEEFYEVNFPDDIPDEWPLAEQEKSHGAGVLGPSETVGSGKLARIWLPRRQRLCWLEAEETVIDVTTSLGEMALEDGAEPVAGAGDRLEPVKKIVTTGPVGKLG